MIKKETFIGLRVNETEAAHIKQLASDSNRTVSNYIRTLIDLARKKKIKV